MPKTFEYRGYKFFFFSNEQNPLEKSHIHVRKDNKIAKFWLDPDVMLASSWSMNPKELKMLEKTVKENLDLFRRKWNEYFNKGSASG